MDPTQIETLEFERKARLEGIERRFAERLERLQAQKQMEIKSLERIFEHRREFLSRRSGEKQGANSQADNRPAEK